MKSIKNKKTEILEVQLRYTTDKEKTVDYKELIEYCLDVIPQGGFTPKDIRDRNRIQNALGKSSTDIELEDADFANLVPIVSASRWTMRHKDLSEFLNHFETNSFKAEE